MTTQEVIKSLRVIKSTCYIGNRKFLDALEQAIKALEAQEWVPCSERFPKKAGRYLVTIYDGATKMVTVARWLPRAKAWELTGRRAHYHGMAWMPLPEPFGEESE